ncbi:MAG: hypothetical protein ACE5FD_19930 [Anaerolineae bacterium]
MDKRTEQAARWIQLLNGRKLHVLMALFVLRPALPVSEREVAALVGCHRGTARETLFSLMGLGLVSRSGHKTKSPWTLTTDAYQLPLPFNHLGRGNTAVIGAVVTKNVTNEVKNPPHRPYSSTSSLSNEYSEKKSLEGTSREEEEKKACDEVKNPPHRPKIDAELQTWLARAGVWRSRWGEAAAKEWMTVEFVKGHTLRGERDGDPSNYVANRIMAGDPPPLVCPHCEELFDWERPYQKHLKLCGIIRR